MVSRRLSILSLISAAALVSGVLIGCGGSNVSTAGVSPTVTATGGVPVTSGAPVTAAPSSTTPQQIQVTQSNGTTVTGTVPPGQPAIAAGSTTGVIPANIPFINGLTPTPSVHKVGTAKKLTSGEGQNPLLISYDQGHSWTWTGLNINQDGSLSGYLVVAAGTNFWLEAVGPFVLISTQGFVTQQLSMQDLVFGIIVNADGIASVPSSLTMKLPTNGGTTANGNFVSVGYPTPEFSSATGSLTITGLVAGSKSQTRAIVSGKATFNDPVDNGTPDKIPSGGINEVIFLVTQP